MLLIPIIYLHTLQAAAVILIEMPCPMDEKSFRIFRLFFQSYTLSSAADSDIRGFIMYLSINQVGHTLCFLKRKIEKQYLIILTVSREYGWNCLLDYNSCHTISTFVQNKCTRTINQQGYY